MAESNSICNRLYLFGTRGPAIGCTVTAERVEGSDGTEPDWEHLERDLIDFMRRMRGARPTASAYFGVIYRNDRVRFYREVPTGEDLLIAGYHPIMPGGPTEYHLDIDYGLIGLRFRSMQEVALGLKW